MRKAVLLCVLMMLIPLCACGAAGNDPAQEAALAIREELLSHGGMRAEAELTADYGQRIYEYTVDVSVTGEDTVLTVLAPEEISGLTARLTGGEGELAYDGAVLETGPLSVDGLTPLGAVCALWQAARSGYMDSSTWEDVDGVRAVRVLCRDPALEPGRGQEATLWLDRERCALLRGELSLDGRRVIECTFSAFSLTP